MTEYGADLGAVTLPTPNPYAVRPLSTDIPVSLMYKFSKLPNTDFGIEGYETPTLHFDHIRKIQADQNWKYNTGDKMRKLKPVNKNAKRDGFNKEIEAHAKNIPGPWTYDIKQEWIHGPKSETPVEVPSKPQQALEFKWKGVPKDKQEYAQRPKTTRKKLDMSVRKSNSRSRNTPT
jgi:hypothetical protein